MQTNALSLLLCSKRFDLIFKYLYLRYKDKNLPFFREMYLEHIRAFNHFFEQEPSDGHPKNSPEDFIRAFECLFANMQTHGFDKSKGLIPIGDNGEISDGAHRLACAAVLGLDVALTPDGRHDLYDYKFFRDKGLNPLFADYAALEYVRLNPYAYIVNLHAVADQAKDRQVEQILEKYGFIFYQKDVHLTFNGYVNLKKLSYGSFWEREPWIGSTENHFAGAQAHARKSMGRRPLRAYVFVCDSLEKAVQAKAEIRELLALGNYSVHINDTREEALWLAETYFNEDSLHLLNFCPFDFEDKKFDVMTEQLRKEANEQNVDLNDICCVGSTPLNLLGLRQSSDLDFLYAGNMPFTPQSNDLSSHETELIYYPCSKTEIIYDPRRHFYWHGIKFIRLNILDEMKKKRNEIPKDRDDRKLIAAFRRGKKRFGRRKFKLFAKIKNGRRRTLVLFGIIKIKYTKRDKQCDTPN